MRCRGNGDGASGLHPAVQEMIATGRGHFPAGELVQMPGRRHWSLDSDFADKPFLRHQQVAPRSRRAEAMDPRRRLQTPRRWLEQLRRFWRLHEVDVIAIGCVVVGAAVYTWLVW